MIWDIQNKTSLFEALEAEMQDCDYVPILMAWSFKTDTETFTFNDLLNISHFANSLSHPKPVRGTIKPSNFNTATNTINESLSLVKPGAVPEISQDKKIIERRLATFWGIVSEFISINKPPKVYEYLPEYNTCFYLGTWWDCVYIFIADNKGFLVAMGAYD